MSASALPYSASSPEGQEVLRLSKLRDEESQAHLARLLERAGVGQDVFTNAEDHAIPPQGQLVLGDRVCSYQIADHVVQIGGAAPPSLCESLIASAELAVWDDSTQIDRAGSAYVNMNRSSAQQRLRPGAFREEDIQQVGEILHEAARFYWCHNEHFALSGDSGWDVVRYGVGQKFDTHVDLASGDQAVTRSLSALLYLNGDLEGGETEFVPPASPRKVRPETGRLLLFPPYWTHPHRALPPLSGIKYVLLGWFLK